MNLIASDVVIFLVFMTFVEKFIVFNTRSTIPKKKKTGGKKLTISSEYSDTT